MFKNISGALAVAITILAALNVYGNFDEVEAKARAVAASSEDETHLSQVSRNPIEHTYVFAVKGKATVEVKCSRSAILVGDYSCERN